MGAQAPARSRLRGAVRPLLLLALLGGAALTFPACDRNDEIEEAAEEIEDETRDLKEETEDEIDDHT